RELGYARQLRRLVDKERRIHKVRQSRLRKKNRGRMNEVDRCPNKRMLNTNRSYAQESQGRRFGRLDATVADARAYAEAARRMLSVSLPLELVPPTLPELLGASVTVGPLAVGPRDRVGVVGPNGAGKTTLLERLADAAPPERTAIIRQGGVDGSNETLVERLFASPPQIAELLVAHGFPLALAERPLASLSPGERARAALIQCWRRDPPVELLILDEPTEHLDFEGRRALVNALSAWPGALVVASHDAAFLDVIGVERTVAITPGDLA
ncbi:MAG: AAA family ATPase, partial [Deltaproteobacteria bacterium]